MEPTAEKGEERPTGQEQGEIKTEVDLCSVGYGRRRNWPSFDGSAPLEKSICGALILLLTVSLWAAIWGVVVLLTPDSLQ